MLDVIVSFLNIVGFKWWLSHDHGVDHHAKRPNVGLVGVSFEAIKDLRCDVIRSSTKSSSFLVVEL